MCYYSPPHARTSRMFSYTTECVLLLNKMCSLTGAEEDPSASASPASRSLGGLYPVYCNRNILLYTVIVIYCSKIALLTE
jgi:hypothetical protein